MSERPFTRRTALLAGGGTAAVVLAGCGSGLPAATPASRTAAALGLPGGEHVLLGQALVVEHAQRAAYAAVAGSRLATGALRTQLRQYAGIEDAHIAALEQAIRRQGGTPPKVTTGTVPLASLDGALAFCEDLEATATGMWTWFAQRAIGYDVRAATVSIMGVEARQLNGLRGARSVPVSAVAPPPLSVPAAVQKVSGFAKAGP